jgi:hypothetical protein
MVHHIPGGSLFTTKGEVEIDKTQETGKSGSGEESEKAWSIFSGIGVNEVQDPVREELLSLDVGSLTFDILMWHQ